MRSPWTLAAGLPSGHPETTRAPAKYLVRVHIGPWQNFYHTSKVYTGLLRLAGQGGIGVEFVPPLPGEDALWTSNPLAVTLDVIAAPAAPPVRVCIDVHDAADVFFTDLLAACDVYCKRSYRAADAAALPPDLAGKVLPFGLNYGCRSFRSTLRVVRALLPGCVRRFLRSPRQGMKELSEHLPVLKQFLACPSTAEFEQSPDVAVEPTILFQTRVWEPWDTGPDDAAGINEQRVGVVRALRKAFGKAFVGGLVPTPFAWEHYPDAVTTEQTRRKAYVAMSKRSLIGIYTRGLHSSIAFKFPEYLAASKCIVTDPLSHELPRPLAAGRHYLLFGEPEECVERCAEVLRDRGLASALRHAAYKYYQENVEPAAHLRHCLDQVVSFASARRAPAGDVVTSGRPSA
jgi:hypothetical protein